MVRVKAEIAQELARAKKQYVASLLECQATAVEQRLGEKRARCDIQSGDASAIAAGHLQLVVVRARRVGGGCGMVGHWRCSGREGLSPATIYRYASQDSHIMDKQTKHRWRLYSCPLNDRNENSSLIAWTESSPRRARRSLKMHPAFEKAISLGTEVAGTPR